MSNYTYSKLLNEATELVAETIHEDSTFQTEVYADINQNKRSCLELYYRYISAANRLNHCYDQMVQPQKRTLVRKMLDSCLGRVLELRTELVEYELSEYTWDDGVLLCLGMTPLEAELDIPEYFLRENEEELKSRRHFVDETLRKLGYNFEEKQAVELTEQQAVLVIQSHERARQGRLRGQFMKEIKQLKEKSRADQTAAEKPEMMLKSALLIQKIWRGHRERKRVKQLRIKEMMLIGMLEPPPVESAVYAKANEIAEYRRKVQKKYEEDLERAREEIETRIREENKDKLTDEFYTEISKWIENYYKSTGKLPEFPSEDAGGSKNLIGRIAFDAEPSKSPVSSRESSKKSKEKDKKSKSSEGKTKEEVTDVESHKNAPSNFLSEIIAANEEFEDFWKYKDESSNPRQTYYSDIIVREKTIRVEDEIRKVVDDMMRYELEQLQAAVDRDRALRGKKVKKQQKKKAKRTSKKSKKKREKDLTPDRTTESLFEELITNGIIKQYPLVKINEFIGEKSFAASEIRAEGLDVEPCFGDIRELVKETCIIPLGSEYLHQAAPFARGVLLTGPPGSGKKMLLHAICTELGAVLFDLTPANIVGKYPGKTGLIMLLHLVSKVSRLLQPSIVWMDYAERPFVKKVPKSDKTDPKRLKKDYYKLIKGIFPEDRIVFIGTSYAPWDADQKLLLQCYSKVITIPRPDYGTMSYFWRVKLAEIGGLQPDFNISTISRICDGYTIGTILKALETILTTKRKLQLCVRGLSSLEVVSALSKFDAVYWEQDDLAASWAAKLPLARRKVAQKKREAEALLEAEAVAALVK